MNSQRFILLALSSLLCNHATAQTQNMEKELADLADKLALQIKDTGKKKVTVLDFTDLQGSSSELGRYVAEQLTVNLVIAKKGFSILDRANLKSILAEHKLTATGLVDPENAKKLGLFAGVDTLVLGNMVPMKDHIELTAKVITTDTAEIVGAAKAKFNSDETVQNLLLRQAPETAVDGATKTKQTTVGKSYGDLRVELSSLRIVNGHQYSLTVTLTNVGSKQPVWVNLHAEGDHMLKSTLTDPDGYEFVARVDDVSGLPCGYWLQYLGVQGELASLKPGSAVSGTVKFAVDGRAATSGKCRIQLGVMTYVVDGFSKIQNTKRSTFMTEMNVD